MMLAERLKLLAAPLPSDAVQWRQDGRPGARQGKWYARFVAYIDAQFVQQRLDDYFIGEWSLAHELLPAGADEDGVVEVSMKARLTIRIVVEAADAVTHIITITREGIGSGRDWKAAATDSFKRAAVRFGIGAELYDYGPNWVEVDSDGKFAKPLEDPAIAYARKQAKLGMQQVSSAPPPTPLIPRPPQREPSVREQVNAAFPDAPTYPPPPCPICGSEMWDNRQTKTGKQPDFKCKTKTCDGAIWIPPALGNRKAAVTRRAPTPVPAYSEPEEYPAALRDDQDDLPF